MRKITLLAFFTLFSFPAFGQTPCSPLSPLDCSDVVVPLPVDFDFNSAVLNTVGDKNGLGTGFTVIMENSAVRRPGDIPISDASLNGYEPSLMTLNAGVLQILSQGGIAFLKPPNSNNNNNQINTIGVGFDNLNETVTIKTTVLNIVTGGGSAQAGIWFGVDEDNFVKLNVNGSNLELRVEDNGLSDNNANKIQQNLGASGQDVILEMLIDHSGSTAEAFYTIGSGIRTSLGSLTIPSSYFSGRDINSAGGQDNISFAGIYATHRAGTQFTATFDKFSVTPVVAPTVPEISAPFRMNVAGSDYIKDVDFYTAENPIYLEEKLPTTVSNTPYSPYTVPGGHQDLYYPRRDGEEFSYNFPIANGDYSVALHMLENFQTSANARIFDVSIENSVVIDDLDLFATYGKGALAFLSFEVAVTDGELNIDFLASVNNGIVQAIEILPVSLNEDTDILSFVLANQTGDAILGSGAIDIEVTNGTELTALVPVITLSEGASVNPASDEITDFSAGTVTYTVTAEDGTTTQDWEVTVTEATLANSAPIIISASTASVAENQLSAIDVNASDDIDVEGPGLQYSLTGVIDDTLFEVDTVTGIITFKIAPDFEIPGDAGEDNTYDIQVTVTDSGALTAVQDIVITVTEITETNTALVINEIMRNPSAVGDDQGEWFELYNPGSEDVDINGWTIKDNGSDSHTIASDGDQLLIPALGYLVLGTNSEVLTNGGNIVDYQYSGITLANAADELILVDDTENEIDRVAYDVANFPNPEGASIALNVPTDDNAIGSNWSAATAAFGIGDLGTPGVSNEGKANESPVISSIDALEVEENQTAVLDVVVDDDLDSEGSGITYSLGGSADDTLFSLDTATGVLSFLTEPDFEVPTDDGADNIYNLQITVADSGTLTDRQNIAVTVSDVDEAIAFEAHVNFSDKGRVPPVGYSDDYGKDFGFSSLTSNSTEYAYGWKLSDTGLPFDASDDAPGNATGVGRNRIGNSYDSASEQEKLEGTLVHFQGDNIDGWIDGQARKNELFWELEIPNGTYEVTLGLGDKAANNIDSRHSATVEGYTILSAFNPVDSEVRTASMVVAVSDGLLTINGLGGFNTKITHIDVVQSEDVPVNGALAFLPASANETINAGVNGAFFSELSGVGAIDIGLVIDDNADETGRNDWLGLPVKTDLGQYEFSIDATSLLADDVRNDVIIATAKGFIPAVLAADLTVIAGEPTTFAFIDDFDSYGTGNLHEIASAQWAKEKEADAAIPVIGEGLTANTTHSLDFSKGAHAHDLIPLTDNPVNLAPEQPFYFGTYFKVNNVENRVRTAIRIDDDVVGDQWIRKQVADDGAGGLIARIGLGNPGSDSGVEAVDSDQVFQFVVRGEWDGENTISYSWTLDPKLAIEETIWNEAGTHTVQGTPKIGRLFISSAGTNDARLGPVRLATDYAAVVTEEITLEPLALTFDVDELNFTGTQGDVIAPQTVTIAASSGTPTYVLSDDPDASEWLILPTDPVVGAIEFGILPNVPFGSYSTTIFASDQPDLGYANAEMTISLEISEPVNDFAVNINFSDAATPAPTDYERDSGLPFGARGNGLNYGWLATDGTTPLNLSANARNRDYPALDIKQRTLIHMQYGDVAGNNGVLTEGLWEIEVPNGTYRVTIGVGDPDVDGVATVPTHRINAENINLIDNITPTGPAGSATRFTTGSQIVSVSDGRLTIDADAPNGGFNTKINTIEIVGADGAVQTPRVVAATPIDGAIQVSVTPTISANDLFLPNLDTDGNSGVDNSTITNATVKLFKRGSVIQVGASVNGSGGGDAINLAPNLPLEANTTYVFEIDGVLDLVGEPFEFFTSSFTTGDGNSGPTTDLDNVAFTNSGVVASGNKYSTLTIGPDGKLYGLVISGDINRWIINPDGTLADQETISAWKSDYVSRTAVGMVFDPAATAGNLIAYVSHNSGGLNGAPDWDGKISRISGANLETEQLLVTDLPRSTKDHLTNSLTFKPGESDVLYFNQGSNSAAGKPDGSWGNREESLLTAAALRLDLSQLPSTLPLNVRTTRNATAINSVDVNSPTLDGLYNPYYVNAPLTLFATGIRNAYDLVWHSNGQLYIPTNGTAGGSNAPASIDGTRRPDGTFYDHSNPLYPIIPSSDGNNVQRDWLFRVDPNSSIGYYGHPNPFRGEFVLNRGDVDVNNVAYNGVASDENYRGAAFDFEFNKSPNGVIEYRSDAENGNLQGVLLVVRYSNLSDIIALVPDGPNGDITTFKEGIPGFGGFQDPLDLIEDVNTGNIYVSDYGRSEIILLKPSNEAVPTPRIVLNTDAVTGDAITSSTLTQEILLSNLGNATLTDINAQLTGVNADQFAITALPTTINAQNSGSFNIEFTPTSNGPKFAQLVLSGNGADSVTIPLRGLGKTGLNGGNEPSLQWILDTQLGDGVINVGDTNPATNSIELPNGASYNTILGDEIAIQKFERAIDAPVTLELLSVYGPTANNPITAFGWYPSGNTISTNELFTIGNVPASNGQTLNAPITGVTEFDPGVESFGFYSRWPFFDNRQLFGEDALNTFTGAIPHHVRVYKLPGEEDAYIIATEEHISGFDYQDIVVIARNIRPFEDTTDVACSPISLLDCEALEVTLPFSLDFDGPEGGLSNTGFTMVDNPSARIAVDGPVFNSDVPGYEPSKLSFDAGNLILAANNGIAFRRNGSDATTSSNVNSQINTLGAGIDADSYGNFSISTSIVNPYTDATNNSEQAGIWFGLNEDNFVKLVATGTSQIELRSELAAISETADQVIATVPNVNTSTVQLRLYVDIENSLLTGYYMLNSGAEVELGSLPLPSNFVSGNATYDNLSFAGIFATKRTELTADVNYTFEDFSITSDTVVAFDPIKINFSLPNDIPPTDYLVDSGLGYADRGNTYSYGWLAVNGTTPLDLSNRARNREVNSVGILQNTLIHMQFQDVNVAGQEGIWEIELPSGTYTVSVGVGDPNVDGQANTEPFHSINVEGVNAIDRYSPTGLEGSATRFTTAIAIATVTDGRLTIDASGGFNTKINSLEITQGSAVNRPFFANVNPVDSATDVRINDFQINVEVIVPSDYVIDNTTLGGNVNLFEVTAGGEILLPSNSNDTGGGDAVTLTPIERLKEFTTYIFRLTDAIEANRRGDENDRLSFIPFESTFTTGEIDDGNTPIRDLAGVEFTKISGTANLGQGVDGQRFSSLVIGPDGKLYASTIGDFSSDGQIYRWDMAANGTLTNLEILTPALQGSPHPVTGATGNNDRLIIGLAFDPASTADNLIAYVSHSKSSISGGPEWDGKLTRLSGPDLSSVQDVIIHLPRSVNDHLTNSVAFDAEGALYISQGSNSAGGEPDTNWGNRPERLLAAAVLKVELNKLPTVLPLSVFTSDDISVINSASTGSLTMSDGTYNPYATNSPLTIFATGVRNAYDLVWHSNGWLYVPTNGTAGNNNTSPNSPSTANYPLARRIDGLTTIPDVPRMLGGETQKDWLFKTKGGSYHGHPNPYRGEFVLNHGGEPYSGLPGQTEASYIDVKKYPTNIGPDPNYREPAFDFGNNKSPNGVIEYKSDAFGGKLQGLLMVVRFSGQDDLLVLDPKTNGDIAEAYNNIPGLGGFDDPLDVVEDPKTGNIYISEYDRDNNGTPRITLLRAAIQATSGPAIAAAPKELIFETTVNNEGNQTETKTVEVTNDGNEVLNISSASITGVFADQYETVQPSGAVTVNPGESQTYTITYAPDLTGSDLGYQHADLVIENNDAANTSFSIGLHALKKAGFEGGEEPTLQDVVDALGIGITVGWTSLGSSTDPAPIGDELEVERWVKATDAPINITPVGRYSPAEELPFGWYTNDGGIATNEVGILAGEIANAQTLFPPIVTGDASFDPQGAVFGFYVESQSFGRSNYTEDAENTGGVAHRTRIYPVADRAGNPVANSYLILFEDASNGDYQDYMFIIDNVVAFESGILALDFDKGDVDFIASINQEDIPVQQITLNGTGGITADGIELEASEEWIFLPDGFELGTSFDIGVDVSGLSIGSYQATVTASALNYDDAIINVSLEVTNELVYTYKFNFQSPDDIEISPVGYINDIGAPYGERNTILGNLTYGWVLPGTSTAADAGVNGRNRNTGTNDDVLLKTFTIIGHRTASNFPTRDWVVNLPNGTYSVNISVGGDPQFSNSIHVLDVNGVTVVDYDQQNTLPETFGNFENTKFVEVIDGTLRLSLASGGENAKVNYVRLAPIDSSLLPPTIIATFEGNENAPGTYRGLVNITLEATDNSESGGIASLAYALDGSVSETYDQPISVGGEGFHSLIVTAEDNNGNISEKTFDFAVEAPTGALLAIENMTKIPGTERSFPANDYYTFHRLGTPGQALVHDSNIMRLNNTGTGALIVTEALVSDTDNYIFEVFDNTGTTATLPITIAVGSFADLDITFIGTTGNGSNGIFVEDIEILSNADNALENKAVLHGAYSPQPEGGDEINAQEVFDAFGFRSSMLSIVNDEGTITPPNNIRFRPSSNYPVATNIDAGYEGDMILSSNFVQADPGKPVIGIQLSALHGGPSSNGAKFVAVDGTNTVGGISFSHDPRYYQTLLPKTGANINFDTANSINGAFRISVSNYLSSGGNNSSGNRPDLLGLRIYKAIDHKGNIIPNEYIVLQDFVQNGCGAGSANCDWNDNTFYFINIRPEGVPTAQPTEGYLANVGEALDLDIAQYFDNGYPGNSLTISASVANGSLPIWLTYNAVDGSLTGTPPAETTGSIEVDFEAVDVNGLTASTSLTISINEPPVAVDDEVTTVQNVAIFLENLLDNDFEPNGQDFSILTIDSPQNGTAGLQSDGISILYTPELDYVGSDSFTYTIEDETGLTASANVSITVTPANQAPSALIVSSVNEGPAALFVEFTGSGSTDENPGTLRYTWNFGDGEGTSTDADTSYTFTSVGTYTVVLTVTDVEGLFATETTVITVSAPPNSGPTALATATPNTGNPLQFAFDGSASTDLEGAVSYLWNFGDGNSSSGESPIHTYTVAGSYQVSLTVTDEGGLTDANTISVIAKDVVTNDFALRINAGGPQLTYQGKVFAADRNFVGGSIYASSRAVVSDLYKTERSSTPKTFDYNIPLDEGSYRVTLHFAEIYWGAIGGGAGGTGKRVFDVTMEGATVLDNFDINAEVGPQTPVTKTFDVTIEDGALNLNFEALGADGIDQPKISAIEVVGIDSPPVDCALPLAWTSFDIGAVSAAGETCYVNGSYEVSAAGADIWGAADEFHYVYRQLEGDGEIIAQVLSLDPTNVWAKAGVMMRNDLDANSALAMMIIAPKPPTLGGPGSSFQNRLTKGATMGNGNFTTPTSVPGGYPHYVRMVRSGNTFTGFTSETNGNWTQVGSVNIAMNQNIFVGLATTSHAKGNLTNAVYENVSVIENGVSNTPPTAIASATVDNNNPLQFAFDGSGSADAEGSIRYQWDFGDGNSASELSPNHIYVSAGTYNVTLTVTDAGGLTDTDTIQVVAEAPVTPDFALRINAGGPQVVHDGKTFSADRNFVGGKSYANTSATVSTLYKTERSALPPNFGYEIPLNNGTYKVTLHFAELFWGATGGRPGGVGKRVFDVVMEGNTVLNDYDIIADVGSQTAVAKTFDVVVQDGILSLALDAEGSDGRNEPKISAIEIVSVGIINAAPSAVAVADRSFGEAPLMVNFSSNGSDDDKEIVSYLWDFKDGTTSSDENPRHIFETADFYEVSLTVSDAEGETDEAFVTITVDEPAVNNFVLRINAGGPSLTHDGKVFSADRNFVGGKSFTNNAAVVPTLYKTERSALPANFGYAVPLENGSYKVTLHFAEIFWGAQGGLSGGVGKRIFDVKMEGTTILDDYDILAQVGPQTTVTRTFDVTVSDGELNLALDAEGSDGRNEPKLSAIEIVGVGASNKSFDSDVVAANSANANKSVSESFNAPIANEVSMYPNAAATSTQITMSNPEVDISKIYVYDVSGRLLRSYEGLELKTSPDAYLLQVSNLENGIYLLRMVTTNGHIFDEKLLVLH